MDKYLPLNKQTKQRPPFMHCCRPPPLISLFQSTVNSRDTDNHFLPHFNPQQSGFHLPLSTSKTVLLQSLMTCESQGDPQSSSYLWLCRIILSFLKSSFLGLSMISHPTSLGSLSALAFHLATLDNGLHRDSPFLLLSLPHLIRQTLLIEST